MTQMKNVRMDWIWALNNEEAVIGLKVADEIAIVVDESDHMSEINGHFYRPLSVATFV